MASPWNRISRACTMFFRACSMFTSSAGHPRGPGCLCQKARNAARALTRFYDRYFSGSGTEPTQFNLLVAIRLSEPVSIIPLADRLGLERQGLRPDLRRRHAGLPRRPERRLAAAVR